MRALQEVAYDTSDAESAVRAFRLPFAAMPGTALDAEDLRTLLRADAVGRSAVARRRTSRLAALRPPYPSLSLSLTLHSVRLPAKDRNSVRAKPGQFGQGGRTSL